MNKAACARDTACERFWDGEHDAVGSGGKDWLVPPSVVIDILRAHLAGVVPAQRKASPNPPAAANAPTGQLS